MTLGGWLMLSASLGATWTLAVFCYVRLLRSPSPPESSAPPQGDEPAGTTEADSARQ